MRFVAALSLLLLALQAAEATASPQPLAVSAFSYNAAAPLDIRRLSHHDSAGTVITEISFRSADGRRIHAAIVAPDVHGGGANGAALFVHWLGDAKTTNLSEFLPDATALARRGCVSLLVDAMWAQPHWYEAVRKPKTDYRDSIRQVVDLRRALDVLVRQPGVDARRIAFVGHDFGAMYGAVLSGVDQRPRWYVLMAGNPSFSEWFLLFPKLAQPANRSAYLAQMARLDPPLYLARSKAQEFLLQFASPDDYIAPDRAAAFAQAVPLPRGVFTYKSDHSLKIPAALTDRIVWLSARLAPPP